jgi:hypothetical protein
MSKLVKRAWNNWDKVTAEWFSFLGWIGILGGLIFITIYELYVGNNTSGFIYVKSVFVLLTIVSSILLIVYLFNKCFIVSRKLLPPSKSRFLWLLMVIEAISLCVILVSIVMVIALTFKTV